MPVQFTKRTWLQSNNRRGNGGCDREVARVHNLDGATAAWRLGWRFFAGIVYIRRVAFQLTVRRVGRLHLDSRIGDVGVRRGDIGKDRNINACVL